MWLADGDSLMCCDVEADCLDFLIIFSIGIIIGLSRTNLHHYFHTNIINVIQEAQESPSANKTFMFDNKPSISVSSVQYIIGGLLPRFMT